jgi:hypothetical protein
MEILVNVNGDFSKWQEHRKQMQWSDNQVARPALLMPL